MNEPGEPISSVHFGIPVIEDDEPATECEGAEHESTAASLRKAHKLRITLLHSLRKTHRLRITLLLSLRKAQRLRNSCTCSRHVIVRGTTACYLLKSDFKGNDEKLFFYTGLSCYDVLLKTFNHVYPHVTRRSSEP